MRMKYGDAAAALGPAVPPPPPLPGDPGYDYTQVGLAPGGGVLVGAGPAGAPPYYIAAPPAGGGLNLIGWGILAYVAYRVLG